MRTSSSSLRFSRPGLVLVLILAAPGARASDRASAFTLISDGLIQESLSLSDHFYYDDPLDKETQSFADEESKELSHGVQHVRNLRWELGYTLGLRSLPAASVTGGTLAAALQDSHNVAAAIGWEATPTMDLEFDLAVGFIPQQGNTDGLVNLIFGYVVPVRSAFNTFGIEPPHRGPDEPITEAELEAALIGGKRRPRGWFSRSSIEWRLDKFHFDPAIPMFFFSLSIGADKQEQNDLSGLDGKVYQRVASVTIAWVIPKWTVGAAFSGSGYGKNLQTYVGEVAAQETKTKDFRGFLAELAQLPAEVVELEGVHRPTPLWELGLRLRLTNFADRGPTAYTAEGNVAKLLGREGRWAASVGGEFTLTSLASSVAGRLGISYLW
ncbi:MAG TPA: hypothetical protein VL588_00300 [Bdellovibrionota bacterium]|nr:hypothetical protein [Bdellovibrionota bacterium]